MQVALTARGRRSGAGTDRCRWWHAVVAVVSDRALLIRWWSLLLRWPSCQVVVGDRVCWRRWGGPFHEDEVLIHVEERHPVVLVGVLDQAVVVDLHLRPGHTLVGVRYQPICDKVPQLLGR